MDFSYVTKVGLTWPRGRVTRKSTDHIQIHHTVGDYGTPAKWRALHQRRINEGNRGVEYSFLILPDGTVYEGRGLTYAHGAVKDSLTDNANQRSVAVAFNGDLRQQGQPTEAAIKSAVRLINDVRAYYGIPVERVLGHREIPVYANGVPTGGTYATLCPSLDMDALRQLLREAQDEEIVPPVKPDVPGTSAGSLPALYEYVGATYVNLRGEPVTGAVTGRVSRGEEVVMLSRADGWAEVVCHEQNPLLRGWCIDTYLERA